MKHKKAISIYRLFLKHLIGLSLSIMALIIMAVVIVSLSLQFGIVLPANVTDNNLIQLEQQLSNEFDKGLLPPFCSYVVIENNMAIDTNMTEKEIAKTIDFLSNGEKAYYDFYKIISQTNGNKLLIKYDMLAHFSNPTLHQLIPYPELLILVSLLCLVILFAVITAGIFSKKLKLNLIPIMTATQKIENHELDFDIELTKIIEINTALQGIDQLKSALTVSLKDQWDSQQQKKSQMTALAHDIKTPLTVIKGNTELLMEDDLSIESKELLTYIKTSTENIEKYLELLMSVVANNPLKVNKEYVILNDFINGISEESKALCRMKNIDFISNNTAKCKDIYADSELLKRAITNIIDNAVRYAPVNSRIHLVVSDSDRFIQFDMFDMGKGFTKESLAKATEEFYTEETARSNQNYGLGLCFAKSVTDIHGGTLEVKNRTDTSGAVISIILEKNISCEAYDMFQI